MRNYSRWEDLNTDTNVYKSEWWRINQQNEGNNNVKSI
jgi:hypothetical protein